MRWISTLFVLLLATVAVSGCFGGDDAPAASPDDDLADEATATDQTGSITGQVVANDLEVIPDALVSLVSSGASVADTKTDKQGRYTLNDIEPGTYRLQVTAACCKMEVQEITVVAGEVSKPSFQLERLTADDLRTPFMREEEWPGFIACGVGSAVSVAVCSVLDGTPVEDPNEEFLTEVQVHKGIQEFVVVMDWEPAGGVSGGELSLLVENEGCGFNSCSYVYADIRGAPALRADINEDSISDAEWKWAKIEDSRTLQFRVFAFGDATVVYQQPFTVYHTAFHYQNAPDDYDPIPDA